MEMDCWQAAEARKDAKMKKAKKIIKFTTIGDLIHFYLKSKGYEVVDLEAVVENYNVAYKAYVLKKEK
jgi:predicted secreted protein